MNLASVYLAARAFLARRGRVAAPEPAPVARAPERWVQAPGARLGLTAPAELGPALAHDLIVDRAGRVAAVKADRLGATRAVVEIWRLEDGSLALRPQGHPTLAPVAVPISARFLMLVRAD